LSAPPVVNPTGEPLPPPIHNPQPRVPPVVKPPDNQQPAPNSHIGSEVSFHTDEVPPSQFVYLQNKDQIGITLVSNVAIGLLMVLRYRWLNPQGEIKEGQTSLTALNGLISFPINFAEGWLISFALQPTIPYTAGVWVFAQVGIARFQGTFAGSPLQGVLWQGYVPSSTSVGWPGTPPKDIGDGNGTLRSIVGSAPAAGQEIIEGPGANQRWNLLALFASLTTSAAVANRFPGFQLFDGAHTMFRARASTAQVASATQAYIFTPGLPLFADGNSSTMIPGPASTLLKAAHQIRSSTLNLQAGDQWTAPTYLVQEWGLWDQ
jgi:hypothetical protein